MYSVSGLEYLVGTPVADQIPAVTEMALFYPSSLTAFTGEIGDDGLLFAEAFLRFVSYSADY